MRCRPAGRLLQSGGRPSGGNWGCGPGVTLIAGCQPAPVPVIDPRSSEGGAMLCLRLLLPAALALGFLLCLPLGAVAAPEVTERARKFVKDHETRLRPLDIAAGLAWWEANTTGNDAAFKKKEEAQNRIDAALADKERFA